MSEQSAWSPVRISEIATAIKDGSHGTHVRSECGIPLLSAKNVAERGRVEWGREDSHVSEAEFRLITAGFSPQQDDLLLTIVGSLGRRAIFDGSRVAFQRSVAFIRPDKTRITPDYLFQAAGSELFLRQLIRRSNATAQAGLYLGELAKITIPLPPKQQQRAICAVLNAADQLIQHTETLVSKDQQIKAGLMHDLFTRGLDASGHLRPTREEDPGQYKETSIGWIPRDWSPLSLGSVVDSLIDGPFGSNLKTEHYVDDGGVRVVRLQNVQAGFYNDSDKAFVSERHARFLSKNSVVSGDVLIAALGDENYPVGRACLYPTNLPPAINKADCFRLRSLPSKVLNSFIMNYLNTPAARSQIDRYKQGVTRQRVNTTNLKKVIVPLPPPDEQKRIAARIALAEASVHTLTESREKLFMLKRGLMNDLLNGTIPLVMEERVEEQAHV